VPREPLALVAPAAIARAPRVAFAPELVAALVVDRIDTLLHEEVLGADRRHVEPIVITGVALLIDLLTDAIATWPHVEEKAPVRRARSRHGEEFVFGIEVLPRAERPTVIEAADRELGLLRGVVEELPSCVAIAVRDRAFGGEVAAGRKNFHATNASSPRWWFAPS